MVSCLCCKVARHNCTPVGRQHKAELKQQLVFELLPQAFVKPKRTLAYFLVFGHEIVLEDTQENGGVIRARKVDLLADEMQSHLENGYTVKEMGLVYNERIEFVLGNDLGVRKIKFTDVVLDQLDHAVMESDAQMLDTHFTLLSLELRELFKTLFAIFPHD